MTREDIIRMAREAGMEQDGENFFSPRHEEIDVHITDLERFAALVAAVEREACRTIAANYAQRYNSLTAVNIADAIQARGQA